MEKRDFVWVGIRIFGIYLLVEAINALLAAVGASLQVYQFTDLSTGGPVAELHKEMYATAVNALLRSGLAAVVYAASGIYLAFGGKLLFRCISAPEGESKIAQPTPQTQQRPPSAAEFGG